jgi:hypothetical protein
VLLFEMIVCTDVRCAMCEFRKMFACGCGRGCLREALICVYVVLEMSVHTHDSRINRNVEAERGKMVAFNRRPITSTCIHTYSHRKYVHIIYIYIYTHTQKSGRSVQAKRGEMVAFNRPGSATGVGIT